MAERPRKGTWRTAALLALALLLPTAGDGTAAETLAPAELTVPRPVAEEHTAAVTGRKLVPVGRAVGIKLFSDGVLVVLPDKCLCI